MKKNDALDSSETLPAAAGVHKPMTRHDVTELVVESRLKKGLSWAKIEIGRASCRERVSSEV